jgi:hypothetical protein
MLANRSGVLDFLDGFAAFPTVFPVRIFRAEPGRARWRRAATNQQ